MAVLQSASATTTALGNWCRIANEYGTFTSRLGFYANLTYPNPNIAATTRPYYAIKVRLEADSNIRMTIWNTTGGYVYVKSQPPNTDAYFMNDGNGNGTYKLTGLSG